MPFPAKVSPQSRRKRRILCIDEHQPGVRARKLILEAAGYRVLTANSGTIGFAAPAAAPRSLCGFGLPHASDGWGGGRTRD